jgi:hypothetical protein
LASEHSEDAKGRVTMSNTPQTTKWEPGKAIVNLANERSGESQQPTSEERVILVEIDKVSVTAFLAEVERVRNRILSGNYTDHAWDKAIDEVMGRYP